MNFLRTFTLRIDEISYDSGSNKVFVQLEGDGAKVASMVHSMTEAAGINPQIFQMDRMTKRMKGVFWRQERELARWFDDQRNVQLLSG